MFSQVCVSHSVHVGGGGGGKYPSMNHGGGVSQHAPGGCVDGGVDRGLCRQGL